MSLKAPNNSRAGPLSHLQWYGTAHRPVNRDSRASKSESLTHFVDNVGQLAIFRGPSEIYPETLETCSPWTPLWRLRPRGWRPRGWPLKDVLQPGCVWRPKQEQVRSHRGQFEAVTWSEKFPLVPGTPLEVRMVFGGRLGADSFPSLGWCWDSTVCPLVLIRSFGSGYWCTLSVSWFLCSLYESVAATGLFWWLSLCSLS